MSEQSVLNVIARQFDRMAKISQIVRDELVSTDPSNFWGIVDASLDQDYENTINGEMLSTLDDDLQNMHIGPLFSSWFNYHNSYASSKLGFDNIQEYLKDKKIRIHQLSAKVWEKALGSRPDNEIIFADEIDDTNIIGRVGASTSIATSLPEDVGDSVFKLQDCGPGSTLQDMDITVNLSLRHSMMDENDPDISTSIVLPTPEPCQTPAGWTDPTGTVCYSAVSSLDDTIDDSCVVTLASPSNRLYFTVGGYVLLHYLGNTGENYYLRRRYSRVLAVGDTNTITIEGNWRYLYYTGSENPSGSSIAIIPMFNEITAISASGINQGNIKIVPLNERNPIFFSNQDDYCYHNL